MWMLVGGNPLELNPCYPQVQRSGPSLSQFDLDLLPYQYKRFAITVLSIED